MKGLIAAVLTAGIIMGGTAAAADNADGTVMFAINTPYVYSDGEVKECFDRSYVYNSSAYVPLEAFCEEIGAVLSYTEADALINVNGAEYAVSLGGMMNIDGVYFAAARTLSDALGLSLEWYDGLVVFSSEPENLGEEQAEEYKRLLSYEGYRDISQPPVYTNTKNIIFALETEFISDHGEIYAVWERGFMYNQTAYIPLSAALNALGAQMSESGDNMRIEYSGGVYRIALGDMMNIGGTYFVRARQLSDTLGLYLGWYDGLVTFSEEDAPLLADEVEYYKQSFGYTGYEDVYLAAQYEAEEKLVTYSVKGGLYTEPQTVELSTNLKNASVYYTVDGSDPYPGADNSYLYTEPILVGNRSWADNFLCNITHVVAENFKYPKGAVMKGTCLKARAFDNSDYGISTKIGVNSYYIADDILTRYGVKVVSITSDYNSLFDPDTGIYTYNNSITLSNKAECAAFMEVFDTEGTRQIGQPIGLRLNGAGTRVLQQKSLRVYARTNDSYENGDKNKFKYDFFDGAVKNVYGDSISSYKRIILRNAGDDWSQYFCRDTVVHDVLKNTGIDTQGYSPAVVFLNGEFWGVYQIRERYDDKYLEDHYDLSDSSDAAIVEISRNPMVASISEGTDEDLEDFNSKAYFIINNDMSDYTNYSTAEQYFDIGNMIDYYIFNIYFENVDWPQNNIKLWRNKNPENTAVDTRWRFLISDEDDTCEDNGEIYAHALGSRSAKAAKWMGSKSKGTLGYKLDDTESLINSVVKSLMKNENFRIEFVRRYNDYLNTIFTPWNVKGHMDSVYATMSHLRAEQIYRYPLSWQKSSISKLKEWAQERPAKARKEIANYFGYSQTVNVTFKCNQDQGSFSANALFIDDNSNIGIGNAWEYTAPYYKNLPLWFWAVPETGYEFDYLTVNGEAWTSDNNVIKPAQDTVIEAYFKAAD